MNGYEEKIKDRLFLEVCNAAGREEWDGLAHQQKENLMLVCRLSGYDEKFQRDCGLVTREQMEHWGIEEEVLFQDAWANMFAKRPPLLMDFEDAYGHHYDQNILSMEKKPERIWRTDADFYVLTNNMDHGAVYMMDEATLQKSAEKLDAVSYTHLDVYKRQFWDRNSLLLGEYWTLNFGESPRDAEESSLSQILERCV